MTSPRMHAFVRHETPLCEFAIQTYSGALRVMTGSRQTTRGRNGRTGASVLAAEEIRSRRLELGLTQAELAQRLGVTANTVARWERGNLRPAHPAQVARRLARIGRTNGTSQPTSARQHRSASRTAENSRRHNFPAELTSFIGRQQETAELLDLLRVNRLITLTGAGGIGKSRLAARTAVEAEPTYRDGAWLVELASVTDPALVVGTVALVLELHQQPAEPLVVTLAAGLRNKHLLLVLDNCEHLVSAVADVAGHLLRSCPGLSVLATSRGALGCNGEVTRRVPSLSLPTHQFGSAVSLADAERSEAVELFVERAKCVVPGFALSERDVSTVARICERLDGIPLAIELAAVRLSLLGPDQILERLNDRFRLLVGGSRTAASRQQTLRATLDWSFALLNEAERMLLLRLSVFVGGWSLEAAEAIGAGGGLATGDILDVLGSLVDQSLVIVERIEDGNRYRLLETVRQYAVEKLRESGEEPSLQERHAAWYLELAERAEQELMGREQAAWLDLLEREHDNLRAALGWARSAAPNTSLRLAASLGSFWELRGYSVDGRRWLEELASLVPERTAARAAALQALGELVLRADLVAARSALEECVAIHAELGDSRDRAAALRLLGTTTWKQGERALGSHLIDVSVELCRRLGDRAGTGRALTMRGMCARAEGDIDWAAVLLQEALALLRPSGDVDGLAFVLNQLGQVARTRGDYPLARRLLEESLGLFRAIGSKPRVALTLSCLGNVARLERDEVHAEEMLRQAMALAHAIGARFYTSTSLIFAGILAIQRGQDARGLRLIGAATQYSQLRTSLDADEVEDWDTSLARARRRLGQAEFERFVAEGHAMELTDVIAYAGTAADLPTPTNVGPLSIREREVVTLIARGCSNRDIGEALLISPRTVEAHVTHVLNKLGARTRAQVAASAVAHGLIQSSSV